MFSAITLLLALVASVVLSATLIQESLSKESHVINPDEELLFVWELVRHGARAPVDDNKEELFSVGEGQLTP